MTSRSTRLLTSATAALALLSLPLLGSAAEAVDRPAAERAAGKAGPSVTVMTRNLYLGADIMRPIREVQGVDPEPAATYPFRQIDALAKGTRETWDVVQATDFATRARLLASELVEHKPDLVGLQEVALWRSGPMDDPAGPDLLVPNATTVELNFLALLRKELKAQGVPYRAVSVNQLSDVEAPAFSGSVLDGSVTNPVDRRLTMRDVILKRQGAPVRILRAQEREFSEKSQLALPLAGKLLDFTRGYQWVDVKSRAGKFRFINSHFEAFSSDIAYRQAREVMNGPGDTRRTTIFVCDCNSDPLDGSVKTAIGDTRPHWAPYYLITGRKGYTDTWLQWAQPEDGWTSGLSELVDDATADGFDHRIDMVFARTGDGGRVKVVHGEVTGEELSDRDASGLWPSDHAGVVMKLRGLR
jgi:endonuclease/exonuclease/phosphatase family metal-dependent hydrolase